LTRQYFAAKLSWRAPNKAKCCAPGASARTSAPAKRASTATSSRVSFERREDLLREARTRINEAINAFDPQNDEAEFEAALAFATDTEEAPATTPAKPMRPLMGEGDEVYEMPDMQAIYMSLPEKDRKTFMKAFEEHDAATVEKLLSAQPPEVRKAMVKMTLAA
jgi:hypothetical protein